MKFVVVATLLLFSLTLRAEKKPATPAKLFDGADMKVITAIGLKPFKSLEGKKEFMLNDLKKELHLRLEYETTAVEQERSKVDVVEKALTGAKTAADIAVKVKELEQSAKKATDQHFVIDAVKLEEAFQQEKLKATKALKDLDPSQSPGLIKSIQADLIARTKKHEADIKELDGRKGRALKQNKEFYSGLPKQIDDLIKAKDPKAVAKEWNKQLKEAEKRFQAVTEANELLLQREVDMLDYARQLKEAVVAFREKETDAGRIKWLKDFDKIIDDIILKPYSSAYFTRTAGQ